MMKKIVFTLICAFFAANCVAQELGKIVAEMLSTPVFVANQPNTNASTVGVSLYDEMQSDSVDISQPFLPENIVESEELRTMEIVSPPEFDLIRDDVPGGISGGVIYAVEPIVVVNKNRFLPMRRRIDRGINQGRFAYKGELAVGFTASYGTMSSDNTEFMVLLDNINLKGTIATVKPFIGYFYRNNRCLGLRLGYEHVGGQLGNVDFDLGEMNDISMSLSNLELQSNSYSIALFHRSYVGLDPRGRFGIFAEVEASFMTGTTDFVNGEGDGAKATYSDNFKAKIGFNPGLAVYVFPNVCVSVSLGLGGIQYSSVTQRDANGASIGSRHSSNMQFRLNIFDINFGMVVHLWDAKKP